MTIPSEGPGYPGSHPHADRPNWRPAKTAEDYLRNCREGLEEYSERRLASLLGLPRMKIRQCKMMAEIPAELFERLLRSKPSTKALAQIGAVLAGKAPQEDVERCPCCGHVLRIRGLRTDMVKITKEWLAANAAEPDARGGHDAYDATNVYPGHARTRARTSITRAAVICVMPNGCFVVVSVFGRATVIALLSCRRALWARAGSPAQCCNHCLRRPTFALACRGQKAVCHQRVHGAAANIFIVSCRVILTGGDVWGTSRGATPFALNWEIGLMPSAADGFKYREKAPFLLRFAT
jgi:hypothetical protein